MTSTNINIGLSTETRNSSRVLKPPGGGHSNIFGEPTPPSEIVHRSKNNQQNSAGMSAVMGTTDANERGKDNEVTSNKPDLAKGKLPKEKASSPTDLPRSEPAPTTVPQRQRVPPGGYSQGLW